MDDAEGDSGTKLTSQVDTHTVASRRRRPTSSDGGGEQRPRPQSTIIAAVKNRRYSICIRWLHSSESLGRCTPMSKWCGNSNNWVLKRLLEHRRNSLIRLPKQLLTEWCCCVEKLSPSTDRTTGRATSKFTLSSSRAGTNWELTQLVSLVGSSSMCAPNHKASLRRIARERGRKTVSENVKLEFCRGLNWYLSKLYGNIQSSASAL